VFLEELNEVEISPNFKTLSEVFIRQYDALQAEDGSPAAYALSDFQKNFFDGKPLNNKDSIPVYLLPLESKTISNLYLDSVWFNTPVRQMNENEELRVSIKNSGDDAKENVPLNLIINGTQRAVGSFAIRENETIDTALFFQTNNIGFHQAMVEISDSPITFDNNFYFSFEIKEKITVYRIFEKESPNYIRKLFSEENFFEYNESLPNAIDYNRLKKSNLLILENLSEIATGLSSEINEFVRAGGSTLIFVGENPNIASYNRLFQLLEVNPITKSDTGNFQVSEIAFEHPIYQGVYKKIPENMDLPKVNNYFSFGKSIKSGEEVLMRLRTGDSFLSRFSLDNGSITISAVPTYDSFSNFSRHSSFVVTMLRIAEMSITPQRLFYTIGKDEVIELPSNMVQGNEPLVIKNRNLGFEMLPSVQRSKRKIIINLYGEITKSGNYELYSGDQLVSILSFNYPREESELSYASERELNDFIKLAGNNNLTIVKTTQGDLANTIRQISKGTSLWKICIIIVLVFLGIETVLLRVWK
jgi:hypothetical protein